MEGQTWGEYFKSAKKCKTKEEAKKWLDAETKDYIRRFGGTTESALHSIKSNLGYMAGYYSDDVAEKIFDLFGAVHPIFGRKKPTTQEAFDKGIKLAQRYAK